MKRYFLHPLRAVTYFLLLTASVVWISFEGGLLPWLSFFALVIQYPAFLLYLLYVNHFLFIHQQSLGIRLTKSQETGYKLILQNGGLIPIGYLKLDLEDKAARLNGSDLTVPMVLPANKRLEKDAALTCLYAGTYYTGVLSYSVSDIFGIFLHTFDVPQKFRVIVNPGITGDAAEAFDGKLPVKEALFQSGIKDELLGNDLKSYEKGDRAAAVHWKLYARSGELFVRLNENRDVGMFTILLAAESVKEESIDDIIMRDGFLTFAVSAAYYFASRNKPVELIYPKGGFISSIVDSYESFESFFLSITEGMYYSGTESARIKYEEEAYRLVKEGRRVLTIFEKDFAGKETDKVAEDE
ncbi:MAG: DUF58 domain-containing protein [Lachnospiraceae bacterium]|nr:DUF58 domain-containing protein [Lachnospiraceae bacterium]